MRSLVILLGWTLRMDLSVCLVNWQPCIIEEWGVWSELINTRSDHTRTNSQWSWSDVDCVLEDVPEHWNPQFRVQRSSLASAHILNWPIIMFNYFAWSQELRVGLVEEFSYIRVQEPVLWGLEGTRSDLGLGGLWGHMVWFRVRVRQCKPAWIPLFDAFHYKIVRVHPYTIPITMKGIKTN